MSNAIKTKKSWEDLGISEETFNSLKWERINASEIPLEIIEVVESLEEVKEGIGGISFYLKSADGQINIINIFVDEDVEGNYEGSLLKIERAVVPKK